MRGARASSPKTPTKKTSRIKLKMLSHPHSATICPTKSVGTEDPEIPPAISGETAGKATSRLHCRDQSAVLQMLRVGSLSMQRTHYITV